MQNLIKNLGLTIKEFADKFEIPYNTVLQWAKGLRTPPKYITKILNEYLELKSKAIQLKLNPNTIYAVRIKTKMVSKGIENEWREFSKDLHELTKKKEIWEEQPNCIATELECYEKIW